MHPTISYVGRPPRFPLHSVRDLLTRSDEALLAVAYVRKGGVGLVEKEVSHLCKRGGSLRVLTCIDFGLTEPAALETLMDHGARVRIARLADRAYHPKVYLGRGRSGPRTLVGSANLTAAGLVRNVEGGVEVSGAAGFHDDAWMHVEEIWGEAVDCPRGLRIPPQPRCTRHLELPGLPGLSEPPPGALGALHDPRCVPSDDEEFEEVWAEILAVATPGRVFKTATGQLNRVVEAHPVEGLLLTTKASPDGKWVPRDMFERVVSGVAAVGALPLNAPSGSELLDATAGLRVHRSSAVFAVLGALERYRLKRRPRVMLELVAR